MRGKIKKKEKFQRHVAIVSQLTLRMPLSTGGRHFESGDDSSLCRRLLEGHSYSSLSNPPLCAPQKRCHLPGAQSLQIKTVAEFLRLQNLLRLEWKHFKMNFFSFDTFIYRICGGASLSVSPPLSLFLSFSHALELMNYTQGCTFGISDILYFAK